MNISLDEKRAWRKHRKSEAEAIRRMRALLNNAPLVAEGKTWPAFVVCGCIGVGALLILFAEVLK
jgi:hypothetical protein